MAPTGVEPETAEAILATLYGERGARVTRLPGDQDDNLEVVGAGGERTVLKVVHPDAGAAEVEMQVAALGHLEGGDVGLELPRIVPTVQGDALGRFEVDGVERLVWRLTWVGGRPLAGVRPRRPALLRDLGRALGRLGSRLGSFRHAAAEREHTWDLARAGSAAAHLEHVADPRRRDLAAGVLEELAAAEPRLAELPEATLHGDANDHNVMVEDEAEPRRVVGLLDFGDMVRSRRVFEPVVAAAYGAFATDDPVGALAQVAGGWDEAVPLDDREAGLFGLLVQARLAFSVVVAAWRKRHRPGDPYVSVSEAQAWRLLETLAATHRDLVTARVRMACGRDAVPGPAWRGLGGQAVAPILGEDLDPAAWPFLDAGLTGELGRAFSEGDRSAAVGRAVVRASGGEAEDGAVGLGRWGEVRWPDAVGGDGATVHLGLDLFVPAGHGVHAPLAATVAAVADASVVLAHEASGGRPPFWSVLRGVRPRVGLSEGDGVDAGDTLGAVAEGPAPHLHLQLSRVAPRRGCEVPERARPADREAWTALCPDPAALVAIAGLEDATPGPPGPDEILSRRRRHMGANLSISYRAPLHLVRGWRQHLFDHEGRAFLDLYNNVAHVGHAHPRVTEAVRRQLDRLATNTRYLHEGRLRYVERLVGLFPEPLEVVWLVNSATEANELALRIARAATGRRDLVVQEAAYHGHTTSLVDASPYKFAGPGGEGPPGWVHVAALPDPYRGRHRGSGPEAGARYAADVGRLVVEMVDGGRPPGAFLAETFPSVGGQIVPPEGYLAGVYERIRAAGGVCIADEVQTGFGRLGSALWGFQVQGVVPDLVVLGKPMGNGFPLAAVVTTRALAEAFDTGMEFFSTFGGNPVACAAGDAVLTVLDEERLQERAVASGDRLLAGLRELAGEHSLLGDVRGMGLFCGVELVRDRETREPAAEAAAWIVERLRERGILTGTDGPDHNVLKLRGPLVLEPADIDRFLGVLGDVLGESPLRHLSR